MGSMTQGRHSASDSIDEVRRDCPSMAMQDLIPEVIRRHTAQGCRFADNASQATVTEAMSEGMDPTIPVPDKDVRPLAKILVKRETYCPHEGIGLGCDADSEPEPLHEAA